MIYAKIELKPTLYEPPELADRIYELLWIKLTLNDKIFYIGGIHHPPKPLYQTNVYLGIIGSVIEQIIDMPEASTIILAGDFNQIEDNQIESFGLINQYRNAPTHMDHALDRIYCSEKIYTNCRTTTSIINTKHKAVVARTDNLRIIDHGKLTFSKIFRKKSPNKHAMFMELLKGVDWNGIKAESLSFQESVDAFYEILIKCWDQIYPPRTITITNKNPPFITPEIKHLLRYKNVLMKAGKRTKSDSVAAIIRDKINKRNNSMLKSKERGSRDLWESIRTLTGDTKKCNLESETNLTADNLNDFFSKVSTDKNYTEILKKFTVSKLNNHISEERIFGLLDKLRPTAAGPDGLPSWLLKLAAPCIAEPLAFLFNNSITCQTVPKQWKESTITPNPYSEGTNSTI